MPKYTWQTVNKQTGNNGTIKYTGYMVLVCFMCSSCYWSSDVTQWTIKTTRLFPVAVNTYFIGFLSFWYQYVIVYGHLEILYLSSKYIYMFIGFLCEKKMCWEKSLQDVCTKQSSSFFLKHLILYKFFQKYLIFLLLTVTTRITA